MTAPTAPWWRRPRDIAALGYAIGTAAAAVSIGVIPLRAEAAGGAVTGELAARAIGAAAIEALIWGALVRAAAPRGVAILAVPAIVAGALTFFTFMIAGHSRPSLFPTGGFVAGCALDLLLVASYTPVLRLARQADARAGDILAASAAWAMAVAMIGVIVAPGVVFAVPCALLLTLAALGVYVGASDVASLRRAFGAGAVGVIAAGALFVPMRLREQAITRHPAVLAVYRRAGGHQCDVRPAGRAGAISLWRQECGGTPGPVYAWDEQAQVLLDSDRPPDAR